MSNEALSAEAIREIERLSDKHNRTSLGIFEVPKNKATVGLPPKIMVKTDHLDGKIESAKHIAENFRYAPARKSGEAAVDNLKSLIDLTNRHKTAESVLFADINSEKPSITAVINYHPQMADTESGVFADFADHRIRYQWPLSEELQIWLGREGEKKAMTQAEFAEFLEDNIVNLVSPTDHEAQDINDKFNLTCAAPTKIINLSRELEIYSNATFKQRHINQSGESSLQFERHDVDAKGEPVKVPGAFMIEIPLFADGETVRLTVRLRYRPAGEKGVIWYYQIAQLRRHMRAEMEEDCRRAVEGWNFDGDRTAEFIGTDLPLYFGKPEAIFK